MQQLLRQLDTVAARMRLPGMWRLIAIGLVTGGVLGLLVATAYWLGAWSMLRWIALGCVAVPPAVCYVIASMKKVSTETAARAIDSHYGLKSRALTLWSYSHRGNLDEAHQLAVQEASPHLEHVDATEVVPVPVPRTLYVGALLAVLTIVVVFLPQLNFGDFGGTADSDDQRQLATDGVEMTTLAPLIAVSPDIAVQSLPSESSYSESLAGTDTSTAPAGSADMIDRYFDALSPNETDDSP